MTGHDQNPGDREFEDFLRRRRPLFRRTEDDVLEPPPELDRLVLRQAREAIEAPPPAREYRVVRWGAPLAIAATLVLGLAFVFHAGLDNPAVRPQVTVEKIAQRLEPAAADSLAAAPAPEAAASRVSPEAAAAPPAGDAPVVVQLRPAPALADASAPADVPGLVSEEEARRHHPPAPPPPVVAGTPRATRDMASSPAASASSAAPWRQDPRAWQAEIERLRASGDAARADAEQAEFNRQHRAMAVSPDR